MHACISKRHELMCWNSLRKFAFMKIFSLCYNEEWRTETVEFFYSSITLIINILIKSQKHLEKDIVSFDLFDIVLTILKKNYEELIISN